MWRGAVEVKSGGVVPWSCVVVAGPHEISWDFTGDVELWSKVAVEVLSLQRKLGSCRGELWSCCDVVWG